MLAGTGGDWGGVGCEGVEGLGADCHVHSSDSTTILIPDFPVSESVIVIGKSQNPAPTNIESFDRITAMTMNIVQPAPSLSGLARPFAAS